MGSQCIHSCIIVRPNVYRVGSARAVVSFLDVEVMMSVKLKLKNWGQNTMTVPYSDRGGGTVYAFLL